MFDTLAYAEKLKAAHFTEPQAKVMLDMVQESTKQTAATKNDLLKTENKILIWMLGIALAQLAGVISIIALLHK